MSRKTAVLLLFLAVIACAAAGAGGAWLALRFGPGMPRERPPEPVAEGKGKIVVLPRFVTDLSDRERRRFVDVTVAVAVADEPSASALQSRMTEVRDAVLGYLRSQGAAELLGSAGKERLASALVQVVAPLVPGGVRKVYITDLLVQ
jgi:flagellar basal body-associated protein FliL